MMQMKVLAALLLGSTLAACSSGGSDNKNNGNNGSSSSSSASSSSSSSSTSSSSGGECGLLGCVEDNPVTELDITNESLPYREQFTVGTEMDNMANVFFSEGYKALNSENPQTLPDSTVINDPHPSFNYPTCCFWEEDATTGLPTGNLIPDLDQRFYVGNGYMAISNARFTIGQLYTDLATEAASEDGDVKSKTSGGTYGSSWGEFDLSEPYRVSFCVKDSGLAGAGTGGNLELFVDNNSGGNQDQSIHLASSQLLRTTAANLTAGNRLVINVPGNVYLQDSEGNMVGDLLDNHPEAVGTEHSYFQMRVSSGAYTVISDFVVESQSGDPVAYDPCTADDSLFVPPAIEGDAYIGLPLDVNLNVSKDDFFGDNDSSSFVAFPDDLTQAFYTGISGKSRAIVPGDGTIRLGNSRIGIGYRDPSITETTTVDDLNGGLDLSQPYRITLTIDAITTNAPESAQLRVWVDNNTANSANSPWGADSRLLQETHSNLGTGELIINVPGDITMNGTVIDTIDSQIGSPNSSIALHCPGNCGDADENDGYGITFSGIKVELQNPPVLETAIEENFSAADADTFFSAAYKSIASNDAVALYKALAGGSRITVDGEQLIMANARFGVGELYPEGEVTNATDAPKGALDLSKPYRIQFTILELTDLDATDPGEVQVYVDNNTTSSGNSIHGGDSKVWVGDLASIPGFPYTVTIDSAADASSEDFMGTATSFLQFRADSGVGTYVIDDLSITYLED